MNAQANLTYDQAVPVIACAIWCCDQAAYPLVQRDGDKECQRLGSKKHSCVLHKLREKEKDGSLSKKSKYPGIQASPRYPGPDRMLIPDIQVGDRVIDAKFPCKMPLSNTTGNSKMQQVSNMGIPGTQMIGDKELNDYKNIDGVNSVEAMTPKDAEAKKGDCKC